MGKENMQLGVERPELRFNMFTIGRGGINKQAVAEIKRAFGEDYDEFRRAAKKGEYIPEEVNQRVDRAMYAKVEAVFCATSYGGERLWHEAMLLANRSVNYARGILFPDQDKRGTMTTNIAWSDNRPSTALRFLTTPTRLIGEQCKYEQGRQLGYASISAEVIAEDENGLARAILTKLNDFLEERLFIGRKGDPKNYHTFSYHQPFTNRLGGVSDQYPDRRFEEDSWVKSLDYPVRTLGMRDANGEVISTVPVLYDPREKDKESAVIKIKQRSLKAARKKQNGGLIETSPYMGDKLGFRLVLMRGGEDLRDTIAAYLEELFKDFGGFERMEKDNEPDPQQGDPNRVKFQRRNIHITGLRRPIEMMVYTLEDWLKQEYEVGEFSPKKNMHDGPAHDLYRLMTVADIAPFSWPDRIYKIDLKAAQRTASFDCAERLGRKQQLYPVLYVA